MLIENSKIPSKSGYTNLLGNEELAKLITRIIYKRSKRKFRICQKKLY